jgi:hypothetical protein
MIETFSDLARLLDDGWRITGITADSDGDRQRFRFEVEAVKRLQPDLTDFTFMPQEPRVEPFEDPSLFRARLASAITPEGWEIGSGFAEFLHSVGHGRLDLEETR